MSSHANPLTGAVALCGAKDLGRHVQVKCMDPKSPVIIASHNMMYICTGSRRGGFMPDIWKAATMQSTLAARKNILVPSVAHVHLY